MIFGKKKVSSYNLLLLALTILRYAVKQRTSLGFSIDNESIG